MTPVLGPLHVAGERCWPRRDVPLSPDCLPHPADCWLGFGRVSNVDVSPGGELVALAASTGVYLLRLDTLEWVRELGDYALNESAAPGSATKTAVRLHDRMAFGYTVDRQPFAAVILVSDPGGSGTFYDLAFVTLEGGKPEHVASAPLGDRVQVQSLSVARDGDAEIVVEMVAQGPEDPMCCPTWRTVVRYALQEGELVQTSVNAEGETPGLLGVAWEWERFVGGDGSVIEVDDPSKYTLTLNADGTYQAEADCNRAGGGYTLQTSRLTLLPGPMTLAECGTDSLYDEFLAKLGDVRTYVRPAGSDQLVLNLFADAGNLYFRPAAQATMVRALEGTPWTLVSFHDGSELVSVLDGTEITADFVEGELAGSAGCNNYFASYQLDGTELTVGLAGSTRKMCGAPKGIMEQEQAYLAALEAVADYRTQGTRLELLDAQDAVVAAYEVVHEPAGPEIVGVTWQWQSTQTPVDKTTVDAPERYTLELLPDGQVSVQADCNRLGGTYTLTDTHITISLTTSTLAACPPDSLADQYVKELSAAAIYFIDEASLFFDLPYDSGTMRFSPSE